MAVRRKHRSLDHVKVSWVTRNSQSSSEKEKRKKRICPRTGEKEKRKRKKVRRSRSEWVAFTRAFEIEQQPSSVAPQHARLVYCILITRDLAVRDVYAKYRNGIVRCVPV